MLKTLLSFRGALSVRVHAQISPKCLEMARFISIAPATSKPKKQQRAHNQRQNYKPRVKRLAAGFCSDCVMAFRPTGWLYFCCPVRWPVRLSNQKKHGAKSSSSSRQNKNGHGMYRHGLYNKMLAGICAPLKVKSAAGAEHCRKLLKCGHQKCLACVVSTVA